MISRTRIFFIFINLTLFVLSSTVQAQTSNQVFLKSEIQPITKLATAIQFETVSSDDVEKFRFEEFTALHEHLQQVFPLLHDNLIKEVINSYSLLYTWSGSNPDLKPVLFSAHMDVVPVEAASKKEWQNSPFAGTIQDGYVWGRGTMDDKYRVLAIMEAVEQLIRQGYQPERTIFLAFGHDEEVGGDEGAGRISAHLARQNITLEAVFDEGLAVAEDIIPGIIEPMALVGTAAKGNLNLKLTVAGMGGHSSVPPHDSPIDILSRAIANLHDNPFEARMTPATRQAVDVLANRMGGKYKFAMRHYGLFKGRVLKMLSEDQATDALIRTKMVPTVFEAGDKSNVLPRIASAIVNIRILTGENDQSVLQHVRKVIKDDRVKIEVHGAYTPPSPATDTNTWVYGALEKTISETFDGVLVVPALFPGSTDSKHYTNLTNNIFRFAPQVVNRQSATLIHNVDERLSLAVYDKCIAFYASLIQNTCGKSEPFKMVAGDDLTMPEGVPGN